MSDSFSSLLLKQRLGGRNLYLVGMMCAGKSATGSFLAQQLGYGFVDMDAVIEKACAKSIVRIFEEEGEESFRSSEQQVLKAIGERHSLVVATGGGVVTRSENWGILHQGIVLWLDPGRDRLISRLIADRGERPLLKQKDPIAVFDSLLSERKKFYAQADLHVDIGDESPELVAKKIVQTLPTILRNPLDLNG